MVLSVSCCDISTPSEEELTSRCSNGDTWNGQECVCVGLQMDFGYCETATSFLYLLSGVEGYDCPDKIEGLRIDSSYTQPGDRLRLDLFIQPSRNYAYVFDSSRFTSDSCYHIPTDYTFPYDIGCNPDREAVQPHSSNVTLCIVDTEVILTISYFAWNAQIDLEKETILTFERAL